MLFQMMFAVITPALITGAYAERIKFSSFLLFTLLWATFIYDPLAHWVWGVGGWLRNLGRLGLCRRDGRPYQFRHGGVGLRHRVQEALGLWQGLHAPA